MNPSCDLFEAFLKCPTKCYLRSVGEVGSGNAYAEWVRAQSDTYRGEQTKRLMDAVPEAERAFSPSAPDGIKAAKWRLRWMCICRQGRWSPGFTRSSECPPKVEASHPT